MALQFLLMFLLIKQIYERVLAYRGLNYLERVKVDAIRRKYRLGPRRTYWDRFCEYLWLPFTLVSHLIYDFFEMMITSIGRKGPEVRRKGQMRRVLKNNTEENQLFRKVLAFLFGVVFTYAVFSFTYYNTLMNRNSLILTTIAFLVALGLFAPFKRAFLCLIIVAFPSLFSSKVRYVLIAYVFYLLYIQIFSNIWDNGAEGLESFGCSVFEMGRGAKKMSGLLVNDIKKFIRETKQKIEQTLEELDNFLDKFKLHIKLPKLNLKQLCNSPVDEVIYECEDSMKIDALEFLEVINFSKSYTWMCRVGLEGLAAICQEIKEQAHNIYEEALESLKKTIEQIKKELYFDVELNHQMEYHYNASEDFKKVFETIGEEFMEMHPFLGYLGYLQNLRMVFLLLFTFWIAIMSFIYWFMFQKSDPWDNTYINEEINKIDAKRSQSGRETVIPLDIRERQTFIYAFDPVMTKIEWRRFVFGIIVFSVTLSQVMLYFLIDSTVYSLVLAYNTFIDVLINIFNPASLSISLKGDNFLANRMNRLNEGFDVKKKIVDRLQECKREPLQPDVRTYKQILLYLFIIIITIFFSSYGLRFRHYVCSIFYPERVPIRAVWLYNNILSRRGNIFHFFRRKLLRKVYGDHQIEKVSILDRLCAQSREVRILFTLLGLYGKHKYCQICGQKVMIDGSDQSISCANKCKAYYCYDCVGEQNNVCAVCMNPIDYKLIEDMSEEMDSSEDDTAYDRLQYRDFWYQYSESETKSEDINNLLNEEFDVDNYLSAIERKDLVRLAYRYDTVDRVPNAVYICDDEDYDAEDESEDYEQYLFGLEQELGIPAEQLEQMKRTAQELVAQDINQNVINEAKIEKYSEFRREDDRRLVRNALYLTNRDKKKYIKKSKTKFN